MNIHRGGGSVSISSTPSPPGHLLEGGDILYPTPRQSSLGVGFFIVLDPETGRAHTHGKTGLSNVNTLAGDKQGMGICL